MNKIRFIELLNDRIEEAKRNISDIQKLEKIPIRSYPKVFYSYPSEQIESAKNSLRKWQQVTQDILHNYYGTDGHENVQRFIKTIVKNKVGIDIKNELSAEYKSAIAVLEGIIESDKLLEYDMSTENVTACDKPKKIFISHSSMDAEFAEALVNMLHAIGVQYNEIFCSSVPGCWVEEGQDFIQTIKKHFQDYELYMLYIHSPRFYNSHVCLNEMGAAWIAQSDYSSFLTSDMSYEQMDAVVRNTEIAIKVDTNDANFRLNDWQNRLLRWLNKPAVETNVWEYHRGIFLNTVKNIHYNQKKTSEIQLSEYDEERLKKWIDSGDNSLFQVWYAEGSATFGLGAKNQYTVKGGREIAEWEAFFKRLLSLKFVEIVGYKNGHPYYKLTEAAYRYFDKKTE